MLTRKEDSCLNSVTVEVHRETVVIAANVYGQPRSNHKPKSEATKNPSMLFMHGPNNFTKTSDKERHLHG